MQICKVLMKQAKILFTPCIPFSMQEENEALQQLVLEVAANKKAARERIASLKQDYNDLLNEAGC